MISLSSDFDVRFFEIDSLLPKKLKEEEKMKRQRERAKEIIQFLIF